MKSATIFLAGLFAMAAHATPLPTPPDITALEQKIDSLTKRLDDDEGTIKKLEADSDAVRSREFALELKVVSQEYFTKALKSQFETIPALIEPSAVLSIDHPRELSIARNNLGSFPVYIESVEPYLDGYKLVLEIGNPLIAEINGTITVISGTATPNMPAQASGEQNTSEKVDEDAVRQADAYSEKISAWTKSLRRTTFFLDSMLKPAAWSKINVIITPAKLEELSHLEVSFSLASLSFSLPQTETSAASNALSVSAPTPAAPSGVSTKEQLDAWLGKTYNELVAVKGEPLRKTPLADGTGYIVTYEEELIISMPNLPPTGAVIVADAQPEKQVYKRTLTFTISNTGIISGYSGMPAARTE